MSSVWSPADSFDPRSIVQTPNSAAWDRCFDEAAAQGSNPLTPGTLGLGSPAVATPSDYGLLGRDNDAGNQYGGNSDSGSGGGYSQANYSYNAYPGMPTTPYQYHGPEDSVNSVSSAGVPMPAVVPGSPFYNGGDVDDGSASGQSPASSQPVKKKRGRTTEKSKKTNPERPKTSDGGWITLMDEEEEKREKNREYQRVHKEKQRDQIAQLESKIKQLEQDQTDKKKTISELQESNKRLEQDLGLEKARSEAVEKRLNEMTERHKTSLNQLKTLRGGAGGQGGQTTDHGQEVAELRKQNELYRNALQATKNALQATKKLVDDAIQPQQA